MLAEVAARAVAVAVPMAWAAACACAVASAPPCTCVHQHTTTYYAQSGPLPGMALCKCLLCLLDESLVLSTEAVTGSVSHSDSMACAVASAPPCTCIHQRTTMFSCPVRSPAGMTHASCACLMKFFCSAPC